jgi:hypothetical protein
MSEILTKKTSICFLTSKTAPSELYRAAKTDFCNKNLKKACLSQNKKGYLIHVFCTKTYHLTTNKTSYIPELHNTSIPTIKSCFTK